MPEKAKAVFVIAPPASSNVLPAPSPANVGIAASVPRVRMTRLPVPLTVTDGNVAQSATVRTFPQLFVANEIAPLTVLSAKESAQSVPLRMRRDCVVNVAFVTASVSPMPHTRKSPFAPLTVESNVESVTTTRFDTE